MGNHCVNILRAKINNKNSKDIKTILKDFLTNPNLLDFDKVIEMPKDLKISMRPLEKLCEETHRSPKFLDKKIQWLETQIKEKNLKDYGYETPEDWALENWGCSCNCYDFHWDKDKNSAVFDTLEYPPLYIVAEIAKATKTSLSLFYAEPASQRFGEFTALGNGDCEHKDYVEETIPEEFHNEFPNEYPPNSPNSPNPPNPQKIKKHRQKSIEI